MWDLASSECLRTVHGDAEFDAVAATTEVIIAGDRLGNIWILDDWKSTPARGLATASTWTFFLAHASPDKAAAAELHEHLERRNHRAFLDARSLRPGDAWDLEIPRALAASRVLVVLVSTSHAAAHYFRAEIADAIARSRRDRSIRVVPVYLDGPLPPDTPAPYGLGIFQAIDARAAGGLDAVAAQLESLLDP